MVGLTEIMGVGKADICAGSVVGKVVGVVDGTPENSDGSTVG